MPFTYNPFTDNLDSTRFNSSVGVATVTGTADRITISGTAEDPIVDIASTYVGQTSITTLGTIATGTWNGTSIGATFGGTGLSTYTTGDVLYASAANTLSTLPVGTNGDVLTLAAGIPSWAVPTTGTVTSVSGTANRITSTGGATPIIDIAATYVGQTSITTLGTVTTGTWSASTIAIARGGTNATSMATNTGIVKYDGTRLVTSTTALIDSSNRMINTSQPCCSVYLTTTAADVTGDGSTATVIFDSSFVNQGSAYDTGTGLFTAPVSGRYQYNIQLGLRDVAAGNTAGHLVTRLSGANRQTTFFNPFGVYNSSANYSTVTQSNIINMTAGQTLGFILIVSGGTKIVDIGGLSAIAIVSALSVSLLN